jgi:hypothetical protein
MLLTDQEFGVSAEAARRRAGHRRPRRRRAGDLLLELVPHGKTSAGRAIVTAGTVSTRLKSLFPPAS